MSASIRRCFIVTAVGCLILPLGVGAESTVDSGGRGRAAAVAHVDFRIIIPQALSLTLAAEGRGGAQYAAVDSNSRTVVLSSSAAPAPLRRDVILSAAGRRNVAQVTVCAPTSASMHAPAPATNGARAICTVSMP